MPLVAAAYCPKDIDAMLRLAVWMSELDRGTEHSILLIRDTRCDTYKDEGIRAALALTFKSIQTLNVVDSYSHWPESPNQMFATAARHIEFTEPQPWLWLEPDAIPIRSGWIDALFAEYTAARRPFMADLVTVKPATGLPDDAPRRKPSGIAIYPGRMTEHAGVALICHEEPWDIAAAPHILRAMHETCAIQQAWRHPPFVSIEQVRREIPPATLLYHSVKDGSLIELLRAERENNLSGGSNAGNREAARTDLINPKGGTAPEAGNGGDSPESAGNSLAGNSEQAPPMTRESGHNVTGPAAQPLSGPLRNQTPREANEAGPETPFIPWASQVATLAAIRGLCSRLAAHATTPRHKQKVRNALRLAGVTSLNKRKRRKK